jgi:hypothetical protein
MFDGKKGGGKDVRINLGLPAGTINIISLKNLVCNL